MLLTDLFRQLRDQGFDHIELRGDVSSTLLTGVTHASQDVRPGDLYFALPGARVHGARFAAEALAAGAHAIVTDAEGWHLLEQEGVNAVGIAVEHPRSVMPAAAQIVYATSQLTAKVYGVTGTNGKTSVVYILATLLELLGERVGLSSTAERRIGSEVIVSDLTSPESTELHALLARMREQEVTAVTLEVSAQAVQRKRIEGVHFDVVAFTNLSHDHLDEFDTMETYFEAKRALFSPVHARSGVVVVDGEWGRRLAQRSEIPVTTLATEYGAEADWHLAVTARSMTSTSFVLAGPDGITFRVRTNLIGDFMAENVAVALVMLLQAGVDAEAIRQMLRERAVVEFYLPGRLERISGERGPTFFVDYGHTPGAFVAMLDSLREIVAGNIIMLFGADGDRDASKRHEMGAVAAAGSDVLIICDYNPRTEDPARIRQALLEGAYSVGAAAEILEIADPATAIRKAISLATKDDVILYAGPGHEQYREVGHEQIAFSARDEVRKALSEAGLTP